MYAMQFMGLQSANTRVSLVTSHNASHVGAFYNSPFVSPELQQPDLSSLESLNTTLALPLNKFDQCFNDLSAGPELEVMGRAVG